MPRLRRPGQSSPDHSGGRLSARNFSLEDARLSVPVLAGRTIDPAVLVLAVGEAKWPESRCCRLLSFMWRRCLGGAAGASRSIAAW